MLTCSRVWQTVSVTERINLGLTAVRQLYMTLPHLLRDGSNTMLTHEQWVSIDPLLMLVENCAAQDYFHNAAIHYSFPKPVCMYLYHPHYRDS